MPENIAEPLLKWYDKNKRILPWRDKNNAYYTWVSEIMLQQTRVEAVKPYFARFIQELPDVEALAAAPEERIVKLWEGLGYYSRVRNMQKAAIQVMEEYDGRIPEDFETLLSLKGIGRYTAGAIASIAYGKKVPAVDGNVLRVLSRLRADAANIMQQSVRNGIEEELLAIMPEDRPGDFNQALMELGAMVCTPNGAPKCGECPWKELCVAHREGRETDFPCKPPKKARVIEDKTVLIIKDDRKAALTKRPEKGLLAGMYEFPSITGHLSQDEVLLFLKERGLSVLRIEPLSQSRHIFSHKEWHMIGYAVKVDELAETTGNPEDSLVFVEQQEARERYPIPTAYKAYLKAFLEEG